MKFLALTAALFLVGCGLIGYDLANAISNGSYDKATKLFSKFCESDTTGLVVLERDRMRREIRKRGTHGPTIDNKRLETGVRNARGPVVRIWCAGERVPDAILEDLVR